MPDKSDGEQPTMEKLESEGVSMRKCMAMGESYGKNSKPAGNGGSKAKASPAPMRKGGGGY